MKTTRGTIFAWLAAGAISLGGGLSVRSAAAAEDGLNACGCRQGSSGACYCEKKSHCGCPGECEPKGCEEKRAKQLDKEVQEETRKAEEAQRRQRARQDSIDREEAAPRHEERERVPEREPAPPKIKIVKMTPAQKRDLGRLIKAYLAEHPDQRAKPIGEVENEVGGR
jgi:hypothetical protein